MIKSLRAALFTLSCVMSISAHAYNYELAEARTAYTNAQHRVVDAYSKPEIIMIKDKGPQRNLMRYLAKVQQAYTALALAQNNYQQELERELEKTPGFVDHDYVEDEKLKEVNILYQQIKDEVGPETVNEAEQAFKDADLSGL